MSELTIYCTECNERLSVDSASRGTSVDCPFCETKVAVPRIRRPGSAAAAQKRVASLSRRGPGIIGLLLAWVSVVLLVTTIYLARSLVMLVGGVALIGCVCALLAIRQGRIRGGVLAATVCIAAAVGSCFLQPTWRQPQPVSAEDIVAGASETAGVPTLPRGDRMAIDGCVLAFVKAERQDSGVILRVNVRNGYRRMSVYVQDFWKRTWLINGNGNIVAPVDHASTGYAHRAVEAGRNQEVRVTFSDIGPGPYTVLSDPGLYRSGKTGEEVRELSGRQVQLVFAEKDIT